MSTNEDWKHGQPPGKPGSIYNFCDNKIKFGGITRLKYHLIGQFVKDVIKYPKIFS